jgi:hypothetical protein
MTQPTAPAAPRPIDLPALAVLGVLVGLYGWLVFALAFDHDGVIGPRYNAPGSDYMVYWQAARSAWDGDFALPADAVALTARINAEFAGWLASPMPLHPWLYPPIFLLALLPFSGLPFAASYALFQIVTFAAAVAGAWCWAATARRRMLWLVGLALAPGAAINVVSGQNAFLTLALLLGGVALLGRADIAAGALLGLLSYKPQFAVLALVALVALRNWRALAGAVASAMLAAVASAAVFGVTPWQDWIGRALAGGGPADAAWLEKGRLWGVSVWTCATLLGAPGWLANAAQGVAALLSAGGVWLAFRRKLAPGRRMAVLLAATLLAAPHCSQYDVLLLDAAVLLLVFSVLDGMALAVRPVLLFVPWVAPLAAVPRAIPAGFSVPLLMLAVIAIALAPTRR